MSLLYTHVANSSSFIIKIVSKLNIIIIMFTGTRATDRAHARVSSQMDLRSFLQVIQCTYSNSVPHTCKVLYSYRVSQYRKCEGSLREARAAVQSPRPERPCRATKVNRTCLLLLLLLNCYAHTHYYRKVAS